jgi:hypothetical protein
MGQKIEELEETFSGRNMIGAARPFKRGFPTQPVAS